MKRLAALLLLLPAWLQAAPPQPLDDSELSGVSARDGINFAAHVVLNDPTLVGAVTDSRLSLGFHDGGQPRYIVLRNVRGTVDMFAIGLNVKNRPDGNGDYIAITLPSQMRYTNFGFESMSVQNDPNAAVTGNLGSVNINGNVQMQGEFRMWAH
ncbi:hypothetical protein [Duganella sp. Root1480D1]|uniref:hypothetical protein n=1 Tax=Duganella sp. Root1480D1 TaxID=1736471 RepID=UPI000708D061|nr:hypothetical protein [Duganella sp. Root1480D1]KQZ39587.1 hypothetical protein ASD58_04105 [Duganella sp. Root1480D1]